MAKLGFCTNPSNVNETNVDLKSDGYSTVYAVLLYLHPLVSLVGVSDNIFFIVVVARNARLRTNTNILRLNVAVADTIICVVCLAWFSMLVPCGTNMCSPACSQNVPLAVVSVVTYDVVSNASILLLSMLAYDALVAVRKPLHYPLIMTKRRVQMLCLSSWIVSCIPLPVVMGILLSQGAVMNSMLLSTSIMVTAILKALTFPVTIALYIPIFRTACKHKKQMEHLHNTGRGKVFECANFVINSASYTLFHAMWTPFIVTSIYHQFNPMYAKSRLGRVIRVAAYGMTQVCSVINPIIYGLRMKTVQHAVKQMCGFKDDTRETISTKRDET